MTAPGILASAAGDVPPGDMPTAVVFGCAGLALTAQERDFFRQTRPLGFILFRRNCEAPEQVAALVADLRASVGRRDAPVLIDQEGGRVARLRPPHWHALPPAGRIGAVADPARAARAAWLHGRLLAAQLAPLGIDVDCAPVADVPVPGASDVIGDRAFAHDPERVAALAAAQAAGLMAGGVLPVVKHLPGHGRARVDSHHHLPVVGEGWDDLARHDFAAFRPLAGLPLGMVAHVVYAVVDAHLPASVSPTVVDTVIRRHIGFDGLLFSDDLSMAALSGDIAARLGAVLDAGCDVALHCNGDLADMRAAAGALRPMATTGALRLMTPTAWRRWRAARAALDAHPRVTGDAADWAAELADILGPVAPGVLQQGSARA